MFPASIFLISLLSLIPLIITTRSSVIIFGIRGSPYNCFNSYYHRQLFTLNATIYPASTLSVLRKYPRHSISTGTHGLSQKTFIFIFTVSASFFSPSRASVISPFLVLSYLSSIYACLCLIGISNCVASTCSCFSAIIYAYTTKLTTQMYSIISLHMLTAMSLHHA